MKVGNVYIAVHETLMKAYPPRHAHRREITIPVDTKYRVVNVVDTTLYVDIISSPSMNVFERSRGCQWEVTFPEDFSNIDVYCKKVNWDNKEREPNEFYHAEVSEEFNYEGFRKDLLDFAVRNYEVG